MKSAWATSLTSVVPPAVQNGQANAGAGAVSNIIVANDSSNVRNVMAWQPPGKAWQQEHYSPMPLARASTERHRRKNLTSLNRIRVRLIVARRVAVLSRLRVED